MFTVENKYSSPNMRLRSGKKVDNQPEGQVLSQAHGLSESPRKKLGRDRESTHPSARHSTSPVNEPADLADVDSALESDSAIEFLNYFRKIDSIDKTREMLTVNGDYKNPDIGQNKLVLDETRQHVPNADGSRKAPLPATQAQRPRRSGSGIRPHDKKVLFVLKLGASFLVVIYFLIPAVVKLNPWLMSEAIFLHRIRLPLFADLDKPAELGLQGAYSFKVRSTDDLRIGAWHILPERFHGQKVSTAKEFAKLLSSGERIIIYLHGNVGTRGTSHRVSLYKVLSKAGFHVIAIDYRGFGDSQGEPTEEGLVEDGLAIYDWVKSRCGNASVFFWGHSLGTGVATQVARKACERGTPPAGVILEAPFTNIIDAATSYPLSMPFRYMPYFTWVFIESIKYNNVNFASDKNIGLITVPVLILHAKDDRIVPFEQGQKLYEVAQNQKEHGAVSFIGFEAEHRYGHDHIHRAPDLPQIVEDFMSGRLHS